MNVYTNKVIFGTLTCHPLPETDTKRTMLHGTADLIVRMHELEHAWNIFSSVLVNMALVLERVISQSLHSLKGLFPIIPSSYRIDRVAKRM